MRCFSCLEKIDRKEQEWDEVKLKSQMTGKLVTVAMHTDCIEDDKNAT